MLLGICPTSILYFVNLLFLAELLIRTLLMPSRVGHCTGCRLGQELLSDQLPIRVQSSSLKARSLTYVCICEGLSI